MVPTPWPWIKVIAEILRGPPVLPTDLMSFCLVPCASVQGQSLTLCACSWHAMGFASGLAGRRDAGTSVTDSVAIAVHRTHPGAASSPPRLSALGIASILPMEKRHIITLGTGWKPYSHMLALALLSGTWKGSKSWRNGSVSWADRRRRCTSCFSLNTEPVIQLPCKTVLRPSHKAFSKIATGISGAWRRVWDAGFWKWWDSWALRGDTVLEVNSGSNVLLCTPARNNLFLLNAAFFHYKNINL